MTSQIAPLYSPGTSPTSWRQSFVPKVTKASWLPRCRYRACSSATCLSLAKPRHTCDRHEHQCRLDRSAISRLALEQGGEAVIHDYACKHQEQRPPPPL